MVETQNSKLKTQKSKPKLKIQNQNLNEIQNPNAKKYG